MFDREEVLGRDAKSVFPTESKTPALDTEAVKAALGSNLRFITETEVTKSPTIAIPIDYHRIPVDCSIYVRKGAPVPADFQL